MIWEGWEAGGWLIRWEYRTGGFEAFRSKSPVAATHPPTGGKAPGTEPTIVFKDVTLFKGV